MEPAKKSTSSKKPSTKKVTDADVVKRLTVLQRTPISRDDRAAVTRVIQLLSS